MAGCQVLDCLLRCSIGTERLVIENRVKISVDLGDIEFSNGSLPRIEFFHMAKSATQRVGGWQSRRQLKRGLPVIIPSHNYRNDYYNYRDHNTPDASD